MTIVKLTAAGIGGNLDTFHLVNPQNVTVCRGEVERPGSTVDAEGKPIMVKVEKTFVHINGRPLVVEETVDEIINMLNGGAVYDGCK
jgi:hypothetical protein